MSIEDIVKAQVKVAGNQPASPVTQASVTFTGETLRDRFAGRAMEGLLASPDRDSDLDGRPYEQLRDELCEIAYEYADAMLVARGKIRVG